MISFKNSLTKNLAMILYPFLGNLTTQIAIFSVFHISNTARSTVIIAMHILTGASVTYGPIGPPTFCLFMKHREKSTTCGSFMISPSTLSTFQRPCRTMCSYLNYNLRPALYARVAIWIILFLVPSSFFNWRIKWNITQ